MSGYELVLPALPPELSAREQGIVRSVEPAVQQLAVALYHRMKARGYRLVFNSGKRSYADQERIYNDTLRARAQGGAALNAAGLAGITARPGTSRHETGLAFDATPTPTTDAAWAVYGQEGEALGLTWGGRWTTRLPDGTTRTDRPHMQLSGGPTVAQLAAGGVLTALLIAAVLAARPSSTTGDK